MAQSHRQSFVSKNHQIDTFWLKFSSSHNHNMTYIQLLKWNGNMFTTLLWIQHLTMCRLAYYWQVEHDFFFLKVQTNLNKQTTQNATSVLSTVKIIEQYFDIWNQWSQSVKELLLQAHWQTVSSHNSLRLAETHIKRKHARKIPNCFWSTGHSCW